EDGIRDKLVTGVQTCALPIYPHRARDPIVALTQTVVALQQLVSRRIDPMDSAVVSVGWIRGGTAENVIAPEAEAGGTLRVLRPRSEERRVGKEGGSWWGAQRE